MATGSITTGGSVSNITGYCVAAEAKYGTNGATGGTPEVGVGHDATDVQTARRVWDADPSDGIDAGAVFALASAEAGGGANGVSWAVAGADSVPVVYVGRTYGAIGQVKVRAAVQAAGRVSWGGLQVKFYRFGRVVETHTAATALTADTTAGPGTTAEAVLTVTPANTNNTKVTVAGYVSLSCPQGVVPRADDLLAQVYVYAENCFAAV